jgi:hypothetical protein
LITRQVLKLTIDVPLMSPAELLLDQVELKMLEPAGISTTMVVTDTNVITLYMLVFCAFGVP